MKKWKLIFLLLLLQGCASKKISLSETEAAVTTEVATQNQEYNTVSDINMRFCPKTAWCVYWDQETAGQLSASNWEEVILFACYYDQEDALYIPPSLETLREKVEASFQGKLYVSVVNDIQFSDGTTAQKDTELLKRLLQNDESRKQRIEELLSLAEKWNCNGVEIDYEKLVGEEMWEAYESFVRQLWREAQKRGLEVRIVLGSNTPVDNRDFPDGPQYVVMCYNLYGYHSGPGPKADREFLAKVAERFSVLPSVSYALSNGGFDWDSEEAIYRSVTGPEIAALLKQCSASVQRDPESHALYFYYQGEDGTHTVWYADEDTMAAWEKALSDAVGGRVKTNLWRLENENSQEKQEGR